MTAPFNPFQPFGVGVRIACIDGELFANHADLCKKHGVELSKASKLPFPNGSVALMATKSGALPNHVYIGEAAYAVFMAWVEGGAL